MNSTTTQRQLYAPACSGKGAMFIEALRALNTCLRRWNYRPKSGETWGYNCRRITGGTGYSLHAYGPGGLFVFWSGVRITSAIATDINSLANPYGPRLVTDMPREMVEAILAIRTNSGRQVFGWGGNYRNNKDAMHYEVVCDPADLRSGINWHTVAGAAPAPAPAPIPLPPEEDDDMRISLAPGEEDVFHIEPTTNGGRDSALGVKKVLLVLNTHGTNRVPVHIWFQPEGGGEKTVFGGAGPYVKVIENRPGGWLHLKNKGTAHVGGRVIEVR
jgi:hypothetical protein